MSFVMSTQETHRLHRWAMWRTSVNEGIIDCILASGSGAVVFPDSDSRSTNTAVTTDNNQFPYISAEQMQLAQSLKLRQKYGSNHGLSDDTYFIFGLPRVNVGKIIPEVTSTGSRSIYGSISHYVNKELATTPRRLASLEANMMTMNLTYNGLGHTTDESVVSNNDMEVQRINGYREWLEPPTSPQPNLYSIQEFNYNPQETKHRASPDHQKPGAYVDGKRGCYLNNKRNRGPATSSDQRHAFSPYASHLFESNSSSANTRGTTVRASSNTFDISTLPSSSPRRGKSPALPSQTSQSYFPCYSPLPYYLPCHSPVPSYSPLLLSAKSSYSDFHAPSPRFHSLFWSPTPVRDIVSSGYYSRKSPYPLAE